MRRKKSSKLLNSDGTLNIKPKGIKLIEQFDVHNSMITMNWLTFFLVITILFLTINLSFTIIYISLSPNEITGVSKADLWGHVLELFFFSTQILTTFGFSHVTPSGMVANSVAAIESVFGVILFAFATGLTYARFARPRPKIIYSRNMVIGPHKGAQALMVRTVNFKKNQLVDLTAEIILTVNIKVEGKPTRFFYTLPLEQEVLGMMMMSWVIVHNITEDSPLYDLTAQDLETSDAEILVMIKGTDDIMSQNVFSRTSFKPSQIIWGAEFLSINDLDEAGNLIIDIGRMHDTRMVSENVL